MDGALIHNMAEIFSYQDKNLVMTPELEKYCVNKNKHNKIVLSEGKIIDDEKNGRVTLGQLYQVMDEITKSYSQGINPNDITLMNTIRDCLNKVNNDNYNQILSDLKSLAYVSENNFSFLAKEIIVQSMNDNLARKGLESKEQKSPSELYASIACEFSNYQITVDDREIRFKSILTKECKNFFDSLVNTKERMDRNNLNKIANYKGFMNMIGLMYKFGLFPFGIIMKCFTKIVSLILDSQLPQEECDNYYSGYERLMNRILLFFEKEKSSNQIIQEFNKIKDDIHEINSKISSACEKEVKPIRAYSILTHSQNVQRFNKLCETFQNKQ
jgi:hypothetical protein